MFLGVHTQAAQGLPACSVLKMIHWIIFRAYLTHRTDFRVLLTPSGACGIRRVNRRTFFESDFVRSPALVICYCVYLCFFLS